MLNTSYTPVLEAVTGLMIHATQKRSAYTTADAVVIGCVAQRYQAFSGFGHADRMAQQAGSFVGKSLESV